MFLAIKFFSTFVLRYKDLCLNSEMLNKRNLHASAGFLFCLEPKNAGVLTKKTTCPKRDGGIAMACFFNVNALGYKNNLIFFEKKLDFSKKIVYFCFQLFLYLT